MYTCTYVCIFTYTHVYTQRERACKPELWTAVGSCARSLIALYTLLCHLFIRSFSQHLLSYTCQGELLKWEEEKISSLFTAVSDFSLCWSGEEEEEEVHRKVIQIRFLATSLLENTDVVLKGLKEEIQAGSPQYRGSDK